MGVFVSKNEWGKYPGMTGGQNQRMGREQKGRVGSLKMEGKGGG